MRDNLNCIPITISTPDYDSTVLSNMMASSVYEEENKDSKYHRNLDRIIVNSTTLHYKKFSSIAFRNIHIHIGRHGVIRVFGTRVIKFAFVPILNGSFMEHLIVSNVRDKENDNIILLKAVVRCLDSFHVKTSSIINDDNVIEQQTPVIGPHCAVNKKAVNYSASTSAIDTAAATGNEKIIVTNMNKSDSDMFGVRIEEAANEKNITKRRLDDSDANESTEIILTSFALSLENNLVTDGPFADQENNFEEATYPLKEGIVTPELDKKTNRATRS
ncbi:MAG: hypothetical protein EXX96DRAFT_535193 [Benjaminiella poitrasii]|nr:MAG: hypothetical protein EXX96DRAFT_535193 [Benjaminiella poitrasii]